MIKTTLISIVLALSQGKEVSIFGDKWYKSEKQLGGQTVTKTSFEWKIPHSRWENNGWVTHFAPVPLKINE